MEAKSKQLFQKLVWEQTIEPQYACALVMVNSHLFTDSGFNESLTKVNGVTDFIQFSLDILRSADL